MAWRTLGLHARARAAWAAGAHTTRGALHEGSRRSSCGWATWRPRRRPARSAARGTVSAPGLPGTPCSLLGFLEPHWRSLAHPHKSRGGANLLCLHGSGLVCCCFGTACVRAVFNYAADGFQPDPQGQFARTMLVNHFLECWIKTVRPVGAVGGGRGLALFSRVAGGQPGIPITPGDVRACGWAVCMCTRRRTRACWARRATRSSTRTAWPGALPTRRRTPGRWTTSRRKIWCASPPTPRSAVCFCDRRQTSRHASPPACHLLARCGPRCCPCRAHSTPVEVLPPEATALYRGDAAACELSTCAFLRSAAWRALRRCSLTWVRARRPTSAARSSPPSAGASPRAAPLTAQTQTARPRPRPLVLRHSNASRLLRALRVLRVLRAGRTSSCASPRCGRRAAATFSLAASCRSLAFHSKLPQSRIPFCCTTAVVHSPSAKASEAMKPGWSARCAWRRVWPGVQTDRSCPVMAELKQWMPPGLEGGAARPGVAATPLSRAADTPRSLHSAPHVCRLLQCRRRRAALT